MLISNDGTGSEGEGNYECVLHGEYTGEHGRTGRVREFSRQKNSCWSLVGAFLKLFGHTKHSPSKMEKDRFAV